MFSKYIKIIKTYRRHRLKHMAVERVSVLGDIGKVTLIFIVLTNAVHVLDLVFANNFLKFPRSSIRIGKINLGYLSNRINELHAPVRYWQTNLFPGTIFGLHHFLNGFLGGFCTLKFFYHGRTQILKAKMQNTNRMRGYYLHLLSIWHSWLSRVLVGASTGILWNCCLRQKFPRVTFSPAPRFSLRVEVGRVWIFCACA